VTLEPLLPPESPLPRGTATPERSPPPPWRVGPDSRGELCASNDAENRAMTASAVLEVSAARFISKLLGGPEEDRFGKQKQLYCQDVYRESTRISA
jgi:hypothetical protein